MTLFELAFACFLYERFTNYDESYLNFLRATDESPDLANATHRRALLQWLNQWGCRQFARQYHEHASREMLSWYNEYSGSLISEHRNLRDLSDAELASVGTVYDSLSGRIASYKTRGRDTILVTFGSTGAAKILFAIRPHALPPWDGAIRKDLA